MLSEQTTANNVWDTKTQTFHGGQEHRFISNFVEDFSVTTNYLGTPRKALQAAKEAVSCQEEKKKKKRKRVLT